MIHPHIRFDPGAQSAGEPLPPELEAIDRDLSRLSAIDAGAGSPGLEERLFAASRRSLAPLPAALDPVAASVDRLAADDHASAPRRLESQAFELSREAVASGRFVDSPSPRLPTSAAGSPIDLPAAALRGPWAGRLRVAAAIALGAAAITTLMVARRATNPGRDLAVNTEQTQRLSSTLSRELETLFESMEPAIQEASNDAPDGEAEIDASWVDSLFSKESM